MSEFRSRLSRENNPDFPPYLLGGTHIRDIPGADYEPGDQVVVSLPWSYNEIPHRNYPVVYLCEGYWDFPLAYGMYGQLFTDKVVPEYILVGLGYQGHQPDNPGLATLRLKDLGPPSPKAGWPLREAKNQHDYLARLKQYIIPFIESEYGVDCGYRVLIGCSVGGVFAIGTLFREPGLFSAIVALSPTVAMDDDWIFRLEREYYSENDSGIFKYIRRSRELPARVFIAAGGADSPSLIGAIQRFDRQLGSHKYPILEKLFRVIDGEKHTALKAEGFNRGLRFAFESLIKS